VILELWEDIILIGDVDEVYGVGLFCCDVGLFCCDVGLFCGDTGLMGGNHFHG